MSSCPVWKIDVVDVAAAIVVAGAADIAADVAVAAAAAAGFAVAADVAADIAVAAAAAAAGSGCSGSISVLEQ